jgi:CRISPR/Cas system CMR subunit Cmr6 (Cas7 group RAMP superfamily)
MPFGRFVTEGVIRAKTPIVHGGNEKTGNIVTLNRITYILYGEPEDVPVISGNAIRGVLRRYIMQDFIEQVEYELDVDTPQGRKLYHMLFTGGLLEEAESSSKSGVIDVRLKREVLKYIPPIRLLGGSFTNQIFEGKLKVYPALPISKELIENGYIPEKFKTERSFYEFLTRVHQTRKDDLRTPREKGEQAVQMIIEYEAFAPGTEFYHRFIIEDPTNLDISILARMLELWNIKPYVGGKSAIGFGEVELSYDFEGSSEAYLNYIHEHRDEIVKLLDTLSKTTGKEGGKRGQKKK